MGGSFILNGFGVICLLCGRRVPMAVVGYLDGGLIIFDVGTADFLEYVLWERLGYWEVGGYYVHLC